MQAAPLLVLCGGLSRRMGTPKPLLHFNGQTLIRRIVSHSLPHRPVWLAAADNRYPDTEGAHYFPDALPHHEGALSALLPALEYAAHTGIPNILVMQCDTLLTGEDIAAALPPQPAETQIFTDADGKTHPLLGSWASRHAGSLKAYLNTGSRRIMPWLATIPHHIRPMPPSWQHIHNFNTPQEFQAACEARRTQEHHER